uniref:PsbP domain-containing protein 3, chloroplastic n=1 Tax=Solanum tuberosum TaxID=4113 RepID=M1AGX1_SOLTU
MEKLEGRRRTREEGIANFSNFEIFLRKGHMNMKRPMKGDNNVGPKMINSSSEQVKGECVTKRRELLLQAGSVALSLSAFRSIALAENDVPENFRVYSDDVNKFKIMIPSDLQIGAREGDGVRSLLAFYPPEASNSNVSIVITSLGADFTKLESFGKVDDFAENLVWFNPSLLRKRTSVPSHFNA